MADYPLGALIDAKALELLGLTGQEFRCAWYDGRFRDDNRPEVAALNALMRTGRWQPPPGLSSVTVVDDARKSRAALFDLTERLAAAHTCVPAGQVLAIVAECRAELSRAQMSGAGLLAATETLAGARLDEHPPRARSGFNGERG